jgi:hypothetical protein
MQIGGKMLEKEIEREFKKKLEKHGAKVWKFISPGLAGVPDRMVLIPGGKIVFVEFKAPGKKLRPLQVRMMEILKGLSFDYWVIDGRYLIGLFEICYFGGADDCI